MLKTIVLPVALVLCIFSTLSAQRINSESAKALNSPTTSSSQRPVVTPVGNPETKRLYKDAVKYARAGLYRQASETFQLALKLEPTYADAYYGLGHAYFDQREWLKAMHSLERAIQLDPKNQGARDLFADAQLMLDKGERTVEPAVGSTKTGTSVKPVAEPVSLKVEAPPANSVKRTTPAPGIPVSLKVEAPPANSVKPTEHSEPNTRPDVGLAKIYRVGANDVLDVRINDLAPQQSTLFTVTPSGFLEHPSLIEPLNVGGLTVEEIQTKIGEDLKRRALANDPKVQVGVRDYASHTILVSGLVKDSGTKILRREAVPLYVVVADAQPLPEAATVSVVRNESNQTYEIDLSRAGEMNMLIYPGDVITLHANTMQFIYVGGAVKLPGERVYRRGLTLIQAILAAGGATQKAKEVRLSRDDSRGFLSMTRFKLKDIDSGKVPDPLVRPGDRILIVE